jgi:hypothetical protein
MLNCKLGELPIKYLGIQMIVKWAWVPWLKCMRKSQKKFHMEGETYVLRGQVDFYQ